MQKRNTEIMTTDIVMEKLNSDLSHWKRELRLDGLDIVLRWLAKEDEDEDVIGCMDSASGSLYFVICLRHPEHLTDRQKDREFNSDTEVTLVHELLHVRDDGWNTKKFQKLVEEDAFYQAHEVSIDAVAEALVRARRGIQR
jgi:hypothetical protein